MNLSATSEEIERKLIKGLRERGYKLTAQRLEIIGLLAESLDAMIAKLNLPPRSG